jgi:hypothetical protein
MGFALWTDKDLLWCAGTHEYRPMGAAVIPANGLFTARDFAQSRQSPKRGGEGFIGYFASLNEVNEFLKKGRYTGKRNAHRMLILPTLR